MEYSQIKMFYSKIDLVDKTKLTRTRGKAKKYYDWVIENYKLNSELRSLFKDILLKCEPYILKNNFIGRRIGSGLEIFSKFLIKREIFILLNKKYSFDSLYLWLHLYEIVIRKNYVACSHKNYQFYKDLILNDLDFCYEDKRKQISNTPNDFLRMKILLYSFNLNKVIIEGVLNSLKSCISRGYSMIGKSIKGVLAGALYLYPKNIKLGLTQKKIVTHLGTNRVTLRIRKRELMNFSPQFLPEKKVLLVNMKSSSIKQELVRVH